MRCPTWVELYTNIWDNKSVLFIERSLFQGVLVRGFLIRGVLIRGEEFHCIPVGSKAAVSSCSCHKSAAVLGVQANCASRDCRMLVSSLYGSPVV